MTREDAMKPDNHLARKTGISGKQRAVRVVLAVLAALALIVLAGPFLVPVPALDTRPVQSLADPDSQFVQVNGLNVHVKTMGKGQPVFVLLHGFGASLYSWREVMEPLSRYGTVIAFDRPAFGLTERPLQWQGQNPYGAETQVELTLGLMDHFGVTQAVLIGNSAGGAVAMQTALAHPERVSALVLVDPAVYGSGGGLPAWARPLLETPQARRLGPLLVRQIQSSGLEMLRTAWHDPQQIPAETFELYQKPLKADHWDRALWEFSLASRPSGLPERLGEFKLPVLVVTGDDDRIIPTANSLRLAGELPNARLAVISNAGHVPHEEKPVEFMDALAGFFHILFP
jgi:pimeloyl-ACP methyl ester carboxylesterase